MRKITILSILLAMAFTVSAQDSIRVLWLGNSLRTETVGVLRQAAAERGIPMVNTVFDYYYGVVDGWQTGDTKRAMIRSQHWDYVVVQILGTAGLDYDPDSSAKYMRFWDAFIDSAGNGAQLVFYHPWATSAYSPRWDSLTGTWKPDQLDTAMTLIRGLCTELSAYLIPVCSGQWEVQRRDRSIRLHTDWIHGSSEMDYLGGMVMLTALTGQDPRGLGNYYNLPATSAHFLQQVAWQTIFRPDILPLILPWTRPALVDGLTLVTQSGATSIEKYLTVNIVGNLHKTDGSTIAGTNNLLYRSLTPNLITVNHLGLATALDVGTAKIEARAENAVDTLTLAVTASTATYDSIRIAPRTFTSYVPDGFKFTAAGYAFHQNQLIAVDFSDVATWTASDPAVFSVVQGRIIKHSAPGGPMWVAVERDGMKDTVRFTMMQTLDFLIRINFQEGDTVFHPYWKPDHGQAYNDSLGYGWVNVPFTAAFTDFPGIQWNNLFFLTNSYVSAYNGPASGAPYVEGDYRIKCYDGDYIVKMCVGRANVWATETSYVRFGADTLIKYKMSYTNPILIKTDTITVRGLQGIFLKFYGPIDYIVIATMAGVNIDSVAYDKPPLPNLGLDKTTDNSVVLGLGLSVAPNPFNPGTTISFRPGRGVADNDIRLSLYDLRGRLVRSLPVAARAGRSPIYSVFWDGRDMAGQGASAGIYVVRLTAGKKGNVLQDGAGEVRFGYNGRTQ